MKLWKKDVSLDERVERFTVGNDHLLDDRLVPHDVAGSRAHARMLNKIGLLEAGELAKLEEGLDEILALHEKGEFEIALADEDCHTAIENFLTDRCGEPGKKIHTGRSRNDQVLTALRLYEKASLGEMKEKLGACAEAIAGARERFGVTALPGYTHMQKAMPTTADVWLGCFEDALADDGKLFDAALGIIDQCPLGTAAGFGVPSLGLDREMTSEELGFAKVMENPVYAQLSRGKFEGMVIAACSAAMLTLNKLASDLTMYNMSEFGYVSLPAQVCTGSSIMPQKRNPDVLELVRAKYHVVLGEELKVKSLLANLISGYNRDTQLTKEPLFNSLDVTMDCLDIMCVVLDGMTVDKERCAAAMTEELFATERAYDLVRQGVPFREAYRLAAKTVDDKR